jgi:sulfur relay protein TusB/DsrH|tara:strand:- start:3248 stop:3547 length:300 start_codon:yes stop_codon:yes gene_type:complete
MNLGLFVSDLQYNDGILKQISASMLGIFLVENGIYHAVLNKNDAASSILDKKDANFYVLNEDLETRGFTKDNVDKRVNIIKMDDLVDLIMGKYKKLGWI